MKNYKHKPIQKVIIYILLVFLVGMLNACYNDLVVPTPTVVTQDVSFSQDILPIFNAKCNTVACHNAGGVFPALIEASAYSSLVNGGFINTENPENSELYQWMKGNRAVSMPPSGINNSDNALVLAWIKQGALNN